MNKSPYKASSIRIYWNFFAIKLFYFELFPFDNVIQQMSVLVSLRDNYWQSSASSAPSLREIDVLLDSQDIIMSSAVTGANTTINQYWNLFT